MAPDEWGRWGCGLALGVSLLGLHQTLRRGGGSASEPAAACGVGGEHAREEGEGVLQPWEEGCVHLLSLLPGAVQLCSTRALSASVVRAVCVFQPR